MFIEQKRVILVGIVFAAALSMGSRAWSQDAGAPQQTAPAATGPAPTQTPPKPRVAAPQKKGKQPYSGPTELIVNPETPMLDEEGRQRLDPDGKPMFNPPVKQQRDKYGHPLFDDQGRPVFQTATVLGYDEHGKKLKGEKEKQAKMTSVAISGGTLTVDGMIGKAKLNYDIKDFKYIYLYAPWIGTVVVSNVNFPGSTAQTKAFDDHTLTVTVEDHQFQLYSDKVLLGKKPEVAYVLVDRDFKLASQYPAMGYGMTLKAPYSWPGARLNADSKTDVKPPPLPTNLRQTTMLAACPAGTMREAEAGSASRTVGVARPCVPIPGYVAPAVAAPQAATASPQP